VPWGLNRLLVGYRHFSFKFWTFFSLPNFLLEQAIDIKLCIKIPCDNTNVMAQKKLQNGRKLKKYTVNTGKISRNIWNLHYLFLFWFQFLRDKRKVVQSAGFRHLLTSCGKKWGQTCPVFWSIGIKQIQQSLQELWQFNLFFCFAFFLIWSGGIIIRDAVFSGNFFCFTSCMQNS